MVDSHETALVHPNAKIGKGTRIGAYSIIGENAVIGEDCEIQEHVVIRGHTTLGNNVIVFPFAVLGGEPQHLKYRGEPTTVEIGDRTVIRESVTIHRGTTIGESTTKVGQDCFLMAYTHVAHDCTVGDHVIIANNVQLAGHVTIGDRTIIGGQSAISQFNRIGKYCYIGGGTTIRKDVPPFVTGKGMDIELSGINVVGMKRNGFSDDAIFSIKKAFKIFFMQNLTTGNALEKISLECGNGPEILEFTDFIKSSKSGISR